MIECQIASKLPLCLPKVSKVFKDSKDSKALKFPKDFPPKKNIFSVFFNKKSSGEPIGSPELFKYAMQLTY